MVQFINHPNWVAQVVFWFVLSRSLFRNHWWPRDIPVQLSVLLSSGRSHFKILLKILMKHIIKTFLKDEIDKWMIIIIKLMHLTDTGENVQKWTRVFSTRSWVILVARTRRDGIKIWHEAHLNYTLETFDREFLNRSRELERVKIKEFTFIKVT